MGKNKVGRLSIETRLKNGVLLELRSRYDEETQRTWWAVHILVSQNTWVRCSQWFMYYGNAENCLLYYLAVDAIEPYGAVPMRKRHE